MISFWMGGMMFFSITLSLRILVLYFPFLNFQRRDLSNSLFMLSKSSSKSCSSLLDQPSNLSNKSWILSYKKSPREPTSLPNKRLPNMFSRAWSPTKKKESSPPSTFPSTLNFLWKEPVPSKVNLTFKKLIEREFLNSTESSFTKSLKNIKPAKIFPTKNQKKSPKNNLKMPHVLSLISN